MANPKKHHTGSRRDSRRAHWKRLDLPGFPNARNAAPCISRIASVRAVVFTTASWLWLLKKRKRRATKDRPSVRFDR